MASDNSNFDMILKHYIHLYLNQGDRTIINVLNDNIITNHQDILKILSKYIDQIILHIQNNLHIIDEKNICSIFSELSLYATIFVYEDEYKDIYNNIINTLLIIKQLHPPSNIYWNKIPTFIEEKNI